MRRRWDKETLRFIINDSSSLQAGFGLRILVFGNSSGELHVLHRHPPLP